MLCPNATLGLSILSALFLPLGLMGCPTPTPEQPPPPAQDKVDWVFSGDLRSWNITLAPSDWQWLQDNALAEEFVPCTVEVEGRVYEEGAIRFKGAYGSLFGCFDEQGNLLCNKLSMKLSFNEWEKSGRFFGLRKLTFNASQGDPSLMRERLSYSLYRDLGLPASRASHAQLTINGENLGVFVLVETVDKEYLQDRWSKADGNLYKEVWPLYPWAEPYLNALRTNKEQGDVSRMLGFHQAVNYSTPESFAQDLQGFLAFDEWARYLAVDQISSNWDGVSKFYCSLTNGWCSNHNFYWYEQPQGPFHVLPWDLDNTWSRVNDDMGRSWFQDLSSCDPLPLCQLWNINPCPEAFLDTGVLPPQCDPLTSGIFRTVWPDYLQALASLRAGSLSQASLEARLEKWRASLREAVTDDPAWSLSSFRDANDELDGLLHTQLDALDSFLLNPGP